MYNYPLQFEISIGSTIEGTTVTDANKDSVLHCPDMPDGVEEGKQPYQITAGEDEPQVVCQIEKHEVDDEPQFLIGSAGGIALGSVVRGGKRVWSILDAEGEPIGQVREKNGWRRQSSLGCLIPETLNAIIYWLFKTEYTLELRGQTVLRLREKDPDLRVREAYAANKLGDFADGEELLLLCALLIPFWDV